MGFVNRLLDEKIELDIKIRALQVFKDGERYREITNEERFLLLEQLDHMKAYTKVLNERLDIYRSKEKVTFRNISFGQAIELCKKGSKIARTGWNGSGMFVYYVEANSYPAQSECIKGVFPDDMVPYGAYLAMKTAQGNVVPWFASQTDVLAEDWCEVS